MTNVLRLSGFLHRWLIKKISVTASLDLNGGDFLATDLPANWQENCTYDQGKTTIKESTYGFTPQGAQTFKSTRALKKTVASI